ncbi:MAG: hypothetical protein L3J83_08940 [Proteobacteria bacterium]|nr:hypothetical protein [Pseudomonadota bacterium]
MKIIILTLLLLSTTTVIPQSLKGMIDTAVSQKSQDIQDAFHQKSKWNDGLAEYLIEHSNAEISITDYQYLLPSYTSMFVYSELEEKWSTQDMINDISRMVKLDQLSPFGLSIALKVCDEYFEITKPHCDIDLIIKKQRKLEPYNAYIYLYPIKKAVEEKDQQELELLLKKMAQTKYIEIFDYTHEKLDLIIDEYYQNHPFGSAFIKFKKKQLDESAEFSEQKKLEMLENLREYLLLEEKINFQMVLEIPSFKELTETCKSNLKYQKPCLAIANILIPNKDIISVLIGHVIKTKILKKTNQEEFLVAEAEHQKYRNEYDCISNLNKLYNPDENFYQEVYEIASKEQRDNGSLAFVTKQTELYYLKELKLGNTGLMNPTDCFSH